MIGETILRYLPKADLLQRRMSLRLKPMADKILEKLGEVLLHLSFNKGGNPTQQFRNRL